MFLKTQSRHLCGSHSFNTVIHVTVGKTDLKANAIVGKAVTAIN